MDRDYVMKSIAKGWVFRVILGCVLLAFSQYLWALVAVSWSYVMSYDQFGKWALLATMSSVAILAGMVSFSFRGFLGLENIYSLRSLPPMRSLFTYFAAILVVYVLFNVLYAIVNIDNSWMEGFLTSPNKHINILVALVVAPIAEELYFRGVVQGVFNEVDKWIGIVVSSLLFSYVHGLQYDFLVLVQIFVVAIIIAHSRVTTRGLLLPTLLHCLSGVIGIFSFFVFSV